MKNHGETQRIVKRTIDIAISIVLTVTFALPMACIAAVIRLESEGPAIFKQKRVGMGGKPFILYKFRSMRIIDEDNGGLTHEDRVTRIGSFLRKWRLDETPQFFNVLKGDMSIIGPRPTLPYQIEKYDQEQRKRLLVKPGITGWAQIHGDEAISWPERIALDNWYIEHWSICLDIKILLKTPFSLVGISRINAASPPPEDEISSI